MRGTCTRVFHGVPAIHTKQHFATALNVRECVQHGLGRRLLSACACVLNYFELLHKPHQLLLVLPRRWLLFGLHVGTQEISRAGQKTCVLLNKYRVYLAIDMYIYIKVEHCFAHAPESERALRYPRCAVSWTWRVPHAMPQCPPRVIKNTQCSEELAGQQRYSTVKT